MSLVLQSSGGGQITIQEPATASNFTQTLPAASGEVMVSGNMPAFSAYQSTSQALSPNTSTKILYQTEQFDTNNNFASSTFTPTVAGYYQISCAVSFGGAAAVRNLWLYKNGSNYRRGTDASTTQTSMSSLIYLNGSTDNVEVYVNSATSANIDNAEDRTWFCGVLVRAA